MQTIRIHTIPHDKQRYETIGDWTVAPDGSIDIYVSAMRSPDAEFLCAVHELVEAYIYLRSGGTQKLADDFDMGHPELDEPGCDPRAPYRAGHEAGEVVEHVLAALLGKDWHEYGAECEEHAAR